MKIKPCPHCGGVAYLNANYSYKISRYFVFVKCDVCGAQGKVTACKESPDESDWNNTACRNAVDAWNMRNGMPEYDPYDF